MKKFFTSLAIVFLVFSGYFISPVPVSAQTTNTQSVNVEGQADIEAALGSCNIMESFSLCVLWFIYHIILGFSTMVLAFAGKLFDYFISYSLNSNSYQNDFITKGWALIRDLANVMFIFTLLYLAIKHILGGSAKNHIPMLIIVALLINFSMFFTKVAIDAGNILARAFYNSINIQNDTTEAEMGFKAISVAVLDKINPQRLLSQDLFELKYVTGEYSTSTGEVAQSANTNMVKNLDYSFWWYAFIFILLAIVNFVLTFTFLSMALLFLGRVIGLWFAIIFSPVAFITLAVPGLGGMVSRLNFGAWRDLVLKQSFLAPMAMFFIYLTVMFLQIMFTTLVLPESQDTFMKIMGILIPFIFIVLILNTAKKVANDMSGEIGKSVKEWGGKAVGFVGGAALGATAFAGRRMLGSTASKISANFDFNKNIAESKGIKRWMYMQGKSLNSAAENGTYDVRNMSKMKNWVGKTAGFAGGYVTNAASEFGVGKGGFGKGTDLSYKKVQEEKEKEALKKAEEYSKTKPTVLSKKQREDLIKDHAIANQNVVDSLEEVNKNLKANFESESTKDTKRIEELKNKSKSGFNSISEKEKEELASLEQGLATKRTKYETDFKKNETEINTARTNLNKTPDEVIQEKEKELNNSENTKKKEKEYREAYASYVENDIMGKVDSFFGGPNRKSVADNIRKPKEKSKKEKAEDAAREYLEEQEKEAKAKEEKPEEPKPDTGNPYPNNP
jgi:hypothetical protein